MDYFKEGKAFSEVIEHLYECLVLLGMSEEEASDLGLEDTLNVIGVNMKELHARLKKVTP
jgi:hypothetical protein